MLSPTATAFQLFLIPLAVLVIYYDVRYRRIPNAFVLATLIAGISLNLIMGGTSGGLSSLGGCVFAFILMFMLHVFGAMGPGDVKLFAAIGSVIVDGVRYVISSPQEPVIAIEEEPGVGRSGKGTPKTFEIRVAGRVIQDPVLHV